MEKFSPEIIDTLASEHLKEGVSPIIASIGEQNREDDDEYWRMQDMFGQQKYHIDFFKSGISLELGDSKNGGEQTYIISPVNSKNKYTDELIDCTSVIAVGMDKKTGKNISFLSHEMSLRRLKLENKNKNHKDREFDIHDKFIEDFKSSLKELKEKSEEKTVDIVIAGGKILMKDKKLPSTMTDSARYDSNYTRTIEGISKLVEDEFGFQPVVITGPKVFDGSDVVLFDNKNRRLYIKRSDARHSEVNKAFQAKDVEKRVQKLKKYGKML